MGTTSHKVVVLGRVVMLQDGEKSCGGKSSTKIARRNVTDGVDLCCADSGSI